MLSAILRLQMIFIISCLQPLMIIAYTLKERICSSGTNFSLRVDPTEKGGKNEHCIVASPESVSVHLVLYTSVLPDAGE